MVRHKELYGGRWGEMSLAEQMGNIGSEVSRALNWKKKGREDMSRRAFERAIELIDMTVSSVRGYPRFKELCRVREALVDFFCGTNKFCSSEKLWRNYFDHFVFLAYKRG